MKRVAFVFFLVFTAIVLVFASDGVIKSFNVESGGDKVNIKWTTENENNVKHFEIERSNGNNNYYKGFNKGIVKKCKKYCSWC